MKNYLSLILLLTTMSLFAQTDVTPTQPGKFAVLPFTMLDAPKAAEAKLSERAQSDAYRIIYKNNPGNTVLDLKTTNNLLAKANVTSANLTDFTMNELMQILDVDYLVTGNVQWTMSEYSSSQTIVVSRVSGMSGNNSEPPSRSTAQSNAGANSARYELSVTMRIQGRTNSYVFAQSRKANVTSLDSGFSAPLEFLWRQTPFYKK